MPIKLICCNSQQETDYREQKYQEFLKYYLETTLCVNEIYKIIGLNRKNSTSNYIRKQLKKDGYDSLKRVWMIKKGEWL